MMYPLYLPATSAVDAAGADANDHDAGALRTSALCSDSLDDDVKAACLVQCTVLRESTGRCRNAQAGRAGQAESVSVISDRAVAQTRPH